MRDVYILLRNNASVRQFVDAIGALEGRFEVHSNLTILDARSILGLYGLDLSSPLLLRIENDCAEIMSVLDPFIIGNQAL